MRVFRFGDDCGLLLVRIGGVASSDVVHLLLNDTGGCRLVVVNGLKISADHLVSVTEGLQSPGLHHRRFSLLNLYTILVGTVPEFFHCISFDFCDKSVGINRLGRIVLTHPDFAGLAGT